MIDPVAEAAAWLAKRRKPDTAGVPIEGFGCPPGLRLPALTIWLPPAERKVRIVFENGVPREEVIDPREGDERMNELRITLISDIAHLGPQTLSVGLVLLEYAALLIRQNYEVTDDELAELLPVDGAWRMNVIEHAMGGEEFREFAESAAPEIMQRYKMIANYNDRPRVDVPVTATAGLLSRLFGGWHGRTS